MTTLSLQTIIGTDKRNPVFTLTRRKDTNQIVVFFGGEIFDIVSEDKNDPAFKLMIAHMFNARVNQVTLGRAFNVSRTTMKRWADGLKSGSAERLYQVLAGRQAPRKYTPEIRAFAKLRFMDIYPQNKYNYSSIIRREIKQVFNTTLSGETLRPLFNALKNQFFKKKLEPKMTISQIEQLLVIVKNRNQT